MKHPIHMTLLGGLLTAFVGTGMAAEGATASAITAQAVEAGCGFPGQDADREALPEVQQLGGVRYLTGGIGSTQARAMREEREQYPLALTFVERYGDKNQFLSRILVEIQDQQGHPVLCTTSDGPYLFVDLPPGDYRISARTEGGRELQRSASLPAGSHRDVTFTWLSSGSSR